MFDIDYHYNELINIIDHFIQKQPLRYDRYNLGVLFNGAFGGSTSELASSIVDSLTDKDFDVFSSKIYEYKSHVCVSDNKETTVFEIALVLLLAVSLNVQLQEKIKVHHTLVLKRQKESFIKRYLALNRQKNENIFLSKTDKNNNERASNEGRNSESQEKTLASFFSDLEKGVFLSVIMEISEKDINGQPLKAHFVASIGESLFPDKLDNPAFEMAIGYQMTSSHRIENVKEWTPFKKLLLGTHINKLLIYQEKFIKDEVHRALDFLNSCDMDISKVSLLTSMFDS